MIDVVTNEPVTVFHTPGTKPYFIYPMDRLGELKERLDGANIRYWNAEYGVSVNGSPHRVSVFLMREADAERAQQILDDMP